MASDISVYVVAGICGNWWIESGINSGVGENLQPAQWTDLRVGFGLGQWTNTGGDTHVRLWKLHDWLSRNGYPDDSFNGQLEYVEYEDVWYRQAEAYQYTDLQDFLHSTSTDVVALTHAWNMGWEGIHDASWDSRAQHGLAVCQYIQENYDPEATYEPFISNTYLSEAQRFNNAMYMYHVWNGGTPSPDPPFHNKKSKLWLFTPPPFPLFH